MKKTIALLITTYFFIFSLTSCGTGAQKSLPSASLSASESDVAATAQISELNVAVFYYSFSDVYLSTVRQEIDLQLNELGVEFNNYDAQSNQRTQTEQINDALDNGANFLIVNIVDPSSLTDAQNIVDMSKQRDIPIVFFNREIYLEIVNTYEKCAYVGTNTQEAGKLQGDLIGDYLLQNYDVVDLNGDGFISYVMFKGQEGNAEAQFRTQFAVENANAKLVSAQMPELVFFEEGNEKLYYVDEGGNWSAPPAQEYMSTFLEQYSTENENMIELVIANNDEMAIGAINALNTMGYNTGQSNAINIPVFGVDATAQAQELIAQGKMTGTIKQNAHSMASAITTLAQNVQTGQNFNANTESLTIDDAAFFIRIPYEVYTG